MFHQFPEQNPTVPPQSYFPLELVGHQLFLEAENKDQYIYNHTEDREDGLFKIMIIIMMEQPLNIEAHPFVSYEAISSKLL